MLVVDARDRDVNITRIFHQLRTLPKPLPSILLDVFIDFRVVLRDLVPVGMLVRIDVNTTN
jgi:hypothetical protein